jgi:hypothetical protein
MCHAWTALVGKGFLHVAALVGAAICSACLRGSYDRWPTPHGGRVFRRGAADHFGVISLFILHFL